MKNKFNLLYESIINEFKNLSELDQAIKNIEAEFGTDKHNNKSTDIKTETKYNDITYLEELIAAGNNFKNTLWLKEQYEGYKYLSTFTGDNYETAIIDFKNELMTFP